MSEGEPLVTVVICVYNAGEYLRPAVLSVTGQTYRNLEILVINDGSTDGCIQTIRDIVDPRIRIIDQENQGKPAALNRALAEMRGEFYAIQDADDLAYPTRIARLLKCMMEHPELAGVMSGYDIILDDRRIAPRFAEKGPAECKKYIDEFLMPSHDPTAMFRMAMVKGMEYDPSLYIAHSVDYTLRVGEQWPMRVVGECLYSYRIHRESITKQNPRRRQREVWYLLRRACERRRLDYKETFTRRRKKKGRHQMADNNLAAHFIESVLDMRRAGLHAGAIRTGIACSTLHPMDLHYYKALVYAVSPQWLIRRLRRTHRVK